MSRMSEVSSFIVMDLVAEAAKFSDAIHFEVGQPDVKPAPGVSRALIEAVESEQYGYLPSLGLPALREKISAFYREKYGVKVDPERIAITNGTSGAFLVAYSILLDAGERLAFSDPGYPCYRNFSHLLNIEPVLIPVGPETDYEIQVEDLKKIKELKALQISSPANPTGNIYSRDNFKALIEYCDKNGTTFISDEIYHGLVYEGQEHTALEFSDNAIVINSFSKYFCAPGLRLGWMILPQRLVRDAEKVLQNVFISAATLSQYGGLAAFDFEYQEKTVEIYRERRDFLYHELKKLFSVDVKPQGAFYLWADISPYSKDSLVFSREVLASTHVALTPGVDFGFNQTDHYVRFAYTREISHMREGIQRLADYLSIRG